MPRQMYAAFYRNLNLGRARAPSKAELEQAFLEAGAKTASSFLVNGTIAFDTTSAREAGRIVSRASASMRERCGLVEPAFVRAMPHLASLVASDPFADVERAGRLEPVEIAYVNHLSALLAPAPFARLSATATTGGVPSGVSRNAMGTPSSKSVPACASVAAPSSSRLVAAHRARRRAVGRRFIGDVLGAAGMPLRDWFAASHRTGGSPASPPPRATRPSR